MNINQVNPGSAYSNMSNYFAQTAQTKSSSTTDNTDVSDLTGVIYESTTANGTALDQTAIIEQMKKDTQGRLQQMQNLVETMMKQQGAAIGSSDDMWRFLASGNFTVTPEVKEQAQKDVSEDGYWGVKQTSDRILEFAKALSGGDSSKGSDLLEAFKTGFKEATKTWGKDLPDISQQTYDAVLEKFDKWMSGTE